MAAADSESPAPSRSTRRLGAALIALVWIVLLPLTGLAMAEWWIGSGLFQRAGRAPYYTKLWEAYHPFAIQYPNPFYLFFFPLEPERRLAIGNEIVSIDENGFRGPGPEAADGRKLGFLIGGSAAFGAYSSSDETTITAYMNDLQDEFHFVNAGVPSWNTTQELLRLILQLLPYEPDLVIAYDGANDAAILNRYLRWDQDFPPGTPENFDVLYEMVAELHRGGQNHVPLFQRFFPRVRREVQEEFVKARARKNPPNEADIERSVAAYAYNHQVMHDILRVRGARFVGVFQPILSMHRGVPESHKKAVRIPIYQKFHALAMGEYRPSFEFHDLSTYFDSLFDAVPSAAVNRGEEVVAETVFIDDAHLHDAGNELIAREIVSRLGL
ncbi:MAG: hypothetical protein ACE5FL_03315 [Myxococcota bacterium]